jgi:hypothetical protein
MAGLEDVGTIGSNLDVVDIGLNIVNNDFDIGLNSNSNLDGMAVDEQNTETVINVISKHFKTDLIKG